MNNDNIKKLARYTTSSNGLDTKIAGFVLNNLSRKELINYLRYLKTIVDRKTVRILSSKPIPQSHKTSIEGMFPNKVLIYELDSALGAGIKAIINDSIIDLTFGGYIKQTISNLKENFN